MDKLIAASLLEEEEGRVAHAYQDHLGYWTIGVGHLIDKSRGGGLPPHIIDALLDYDIDAKWNEVLARWPWMDNLDDVRQFVFLSMAFQMGTSRMSTFGNTLAAAERKDWPAVSNGMKLSEWHKQTPARVDRLRQMIETGQYVSKNGKAAT